MVDPEKKNKSADKTSDFEIELLFESIGGQASEDDPEADRVVKLLREETLKFRDKLKEDSGYVLTVGDVRAALDIIEAKLNNLPGTEEATDEQKELGLLLFDKLVLFE